MTRLFCLLAVYVTVAFAGGIPGEMQRAYRFSYDFNNAVTINPASVGRHLQPQLTVAYFPLYEDGDQANYFSAAFPVLEKITLGIARLEAGMGGIAGVDVLNRATGISYSDRQALYLFSAAQAVDERLSIGINLKVADHRCLGGRAAGWGIDAGCRFAPAPGLTLGAAVHNLLLRPVLQVDSDQVVWPTSVITEAAYRVVENLELQAEVGIDDLFAPDEDYRDGMPAVLRWRLGAAYRIMDNGKALVKLAPNEAEAGITYRHDIFRISYGLAYHYHLGFSYRTALELRYGRSRNEMESRQQVAVSSTKVTRSGKRAGQLLRKGDYWLAAREYGRLQAVHPDSQRIKHEAGAGLALSLQGMDLHYAAEKALAATGVEALDNADRTTMLYNRFKRAIRIRETARAEMLFAELQNAGSRDDTGDRARYDMAVMCRRTGQAGRIPALLQGIRAESGCYMYAQYWLGQLAYAGDDTDAALAFFDRVIAARPQDDAQNAFRYKAQQKAGHILFGLARYDDAYDRYARALGGRYRRDETLLGITWTFFRQREFKRALGAAEQLLREHAGSPYAAEASLVSAYCFMVLDYYEEALEHFDRAIGAAVPSGIDTAAAAVAAAEGMEKIRVLHRRQRESEEQLVAYLTDPALIPLADARERLLAKIDVIAQKIRGMERSILSFRRTAATDRVSMAVRRDAEFGMAMVDGLLKEEKMKMMKEAYERKMQELEQMMDDAE